MLPIKGHVETFRRLIMLKESVDRPAWSSSEMGGFESWKHKQGRTFEEHFYGHTIGLQNRRQAVEVMETSK